MIWAKRIHFFLFKTKFYAKKQFARNCGMQFRRVVHIKPDLYQLFVLPKAITGSSDTLLQYPIWLCIKVQKILIFIYRSTLPKSSHLLGLNHKQIFPKLKFFYSWIKYTYFLLTESKCKDKKKTKTCKKWKKKGKCSKKKIAKQCKKTCKKCW